MCTRTHSYRKSVAVVWLWYILCASLISSTAGFCCMMNRQRQRWTPISTSISTSTSCVMPLKSEANGLNSIDSEQHQEDELSPAQLSPSASPSPSPSLLSTLLSRFQGDFDNYNQVYSDRSNGLLPREGGGHEHFHVTLLPLPATIIPEHLFPLSGLVSETETETKTKMERGAVVAAYYFDGMPNRIFRLRMYTLSSFKVDADADVSAAAAADVEREEVHMKLYTFDPKLEGKLRQESEDVVDKWVDIISDHLVVQDGDGDDDDDVDQQELFQELERCDIVWTSEPDPVRHAYLEDYAFPEDNDKQTTTNGIDHPDPVHAIMVNDHEKGGVLLESQMMPGSFLRIQDELSLWENQLWINDRGHDAESKAMVYGNWEGVPYQMDRVATISTSDNETESESMQRKIVDSSLRWTLGDRWRSEEEYESKMAAVGGLTTRMNQNKAKR